MGLTVEKERAGVEEDSFLFDYDFDKPIPCDVDECKNVAKYKTHSACCKCMFLLCANCLIETKEYLASVAGLPGICKYCNRNLTLSVDWLVVDGKI